MRGIHDGVTQAQAQIAIGKQSITCLIKVTVRGVAEAAVPRFNTDVMPVLTKSGCNQGACHGAQYADHGQIHSSVN